MNPTWARRSGRRSKCRLRTTSSKIATRLCRSGSIRRATCTCRWRVGSESAHGTSEVRTQRRGARVQPAANRRRRVPEGLHRWLGRGALKEPTGVAVDSSGNLWVADHGDNRIEELSPSGAPVEVNGKPVEIESEGVGSRRARRSRGRVRDRQEQRGLLRLVLAPPCSHLVEYDAAGVQVADVGAGSFEAGPHALVGFPPMVAVDEASGRVYVTDGRAKRCGSSRRPLRLWSKRSWPPKSASLKRSSVRSSNPGGIETTYRFEYDTSGIPSGRRSSSRSERAVPRRQRRRRLHLAHGVGGGERPAPGTTYHYRVVATNELAPAGVAGPDQTFTTETAEQAACPNEQLRGGFSARLPDCRAYELVTPPTKTSVQVEGAGAPAADGERDRVRHA